MGWVDSQAFFRFFAFFLLLQSLPIHCWVQASPSNLPSLLIWSWAERTQFFPTTALMSSMHLFWSLPWLRLDVRGLHIDALWVHRPSLCFATSPTELRDPLKNVLEACALTNVFVPHPVSKTNSQDVTFQRSFHLQTGHTFPRQKIILGIGL